MSIAEQLEGLPSVRALGAKGIRLDLSALRVTAAGDLVGACVPVEHDHGGDSPRPSYEWSISLDGQPLVEGELPAAFVAADPLSRLAPEIEGALSRAAP